jgi:methionine sulfoxide reductase heme-binding subunit
LFPLLRLVWAGLHARLGVNPVETVEHATGDWALNFLCITLAVTPLVRTTGWAWWMKQRRMLGLFVAFYATLHFLTYLTFDLEFEWGDLAHDIAKRPFILVGFLALLMITALAATSTDGMIRRLKKWWIRIHWLIYPAAVLAVIHYYWLVKSDHRWPLKYAAVVALLLAYRLGSRLRTA